MNDIQQFFKVTEYKNQFLPDGSTLKTLTRRTKAQYHKSLQYFLDNELITPEDIVITEIDENDNILQRVIVDAPDYCWTFPIKLDDPIAHDLIREAINAPEVEEL